jgi:crotonobetainyl-CoA:carnitine CoA-transferase CaiB-like acyl-CoA transferase
MLGVPVRLSETPGAVRAPAPELGQHTEEVLLDVLGLEWDQITRLREQEVI